MFNFLLNLKDYSCIWTKFCTRTSNSITRWSNIYFTKYRCFNKWTTKLNFSSVNKCINLKLIFILTVIQIPSNILTTNGQLANNTTSQSQAISLANGLQGVYMVVPNTTTTTATTTANNTLTTNTRLINNTPQMQQQEVVTEEEPLYVNAKQYNRILKRRQARAKLETEGRIPRDRPVILYFFI